MQELRLVPLFISVTLNLDDYRKKRINIGEVHYMISSAA